MIGRRLINLSRWILLLGAVGIVWLWGGTRTWTKEAASWFLLADTAVFVLGLLAVRRLPRIPLLAFLPLVLLLGYGWILALNTPSDDYIINAQSFPCEGFVFHSLPSYIPRFISQPAMLLVSGLLGAFCIACDLALNRLWRRRLWITLAVCGVGFVLLALAQRFSGAHSIYWNLYEDPGPQFFGTFRYHANAGAYLNLVLPLLAGLALLPSREGSRGIARALCISAALITFGACFVNISRGSEIVTGILVLLGLPWLLSISDTGHHHHEKPRFPRWLIVVGVILLGTALALSFGTDKMQGKWKESSLADEGRLLTDRVIIDQILPFAAWTGTGPGSFEYVFQSVVEYNKIPVEGYWDKAHNDHLQTLVEWGAGGYFCWAILFFGALIRGIILAWRGASLEAKLLGACGTLSLTGILIHAIGDFPLQISSLQLTALCIAGLLWGSDIPSRRERDRTES
jgi:hypothetical protein